MKFLNLFILVLLFIAPAAHAGMDDGLYDPLPPEGAAFIRFINAGESDASASAGGKDFGEWAHQSVSPYYVIGKGQAQITFGDHDADKDIEEGGFYSVILNDGLLILSDTPNADRTKSQIQFYNLSDHGALTLKTADGKIQITDPAAPNENRVRPINAVKLETVLYSGDAQIGDISTINLKRGMVHSAFVFSGEDKILWVTNTTDTTK